MVDADSTWARAGAVLAGLRARRVARVDTALETLPRIRAVLEFRRLAGMSWWWGPPERFPALAGELELQRLELEDEHFEN